MGVAQVIMESEICHDTLPASWRFRWGNSVWGWSSKNLGWTGKSGARGAAGGLWNLENQLLGCPRAGRERSLSSRGELSPSFAFLFYLVPQQSRRCPPKLVRTDLFTQSRNSNGGLFPKHPDKLINNVLPAIWASFSSVMLMHKYNHQSIVSSLEIRWVEFFVFLILVI